MPSLVLLLGNGHNGEEMVAHERPCLSDVYAWLVLGGTAGCTLSRIACSFERLDRVICPSHLIKILKGLTVIVFESQLHSRTIVSDE